MNGPVLTKLRIQAVIVLRRVNSEKRSAGMTGRLNSVEATTVKVQISLSFARILSSEEVVVQAITKD